MCRCVAWYNCTAQSCITWSLLTQVKVSRQCQSKLLPKRCMSVPLTHSPSQSGLAALGNISESQLWSSTVRTNSLRHRMGNHTQGVRWSSSDSALPHPTVRRYGRVRSALCAATRPGEKVRVKGTSRQKIHRCSCYVA